MSGPTETLPLTAYRLPFTNETILHRHKKTIDGWKKWVYNINKTNGNGYARNTIDAG